MRPTLEDVCVADSCASRCWDNIELLWDSRPGYQWTPFHPRTWVRDRELQSLFLSRTPPPNLVALHDSGAPPRGRSSSSPPVLLVPGATKNANYFLDPCDDGRSGLPAFLKERGRRVFALSFSHTQGDNFEQAVQIGNAVARIKEITGHGRVDLLAHSKGGVAARIYASGLRQDWMPEFEHDIRRLLLVGVPNGGVDFFFRYPQFNYGLLKDSNDPLLNWPTTWSRAKLDRGWIDCSHLSYESLYWPGQAQLLARWDSLYPLPEESPDWYSTYYGGEGDVSAAPGIEQIVDLAGDVIGRLRESPVPSSVETILLAGNSPTMPGFLNEKSGPSDGVVLVDSALELPDGKGKVTRKVMTLHHKDLIVDRGALAFIAESLL